MRLRLRSLTGVLPEPAIAKFPVRAIGVLIALAAAESAAFRPVVAAVAVLPAIVAIATFAAARPVAVIPVVSVAAEILPIAAIVPVIIVPVIVVALIAVVAIAVIARLAVFVPVLIVEITRLLCERLLLRRRLRPVTGRLLLLRLNAELVAFVVTELVAVAPLGTGKRVRACSAVAEGVDAALLRHLLAIAQDDAVIVLGVLEIVFRKHRIAG